MIDVEMASFSMMNIVIFVTMDENNFHYIDSVPEVMVSKVLASNRIIDIYKKIPKLGDTYISPSLQVVLDVGNVQQRSGVKRKKKVVEEAQASKESKEENQGFCD
ncbi:unnamed protein product [Lactuca virosa]|uniref:Uncharacterized protein n=1 Tax=Lactuca virosa TaxID=75947 RepID=A0AAU9NMJ6_9ASTR|nr:unnamed protein product [Lactuca virosa]